MTKEEHYKKAKELIEKQPEKGKSYIRGSLTVKPTGPLSDKLRELLHGNVEASQKKTARKKKRTGTKTKSRRS